MEVVKKNVVEKNAKQLINEYCQQQKISLPMYVCTPDQEKNPNGYFCTLTVGSQSFCTSSWQKTKKNAELEGARLACKKFNLKEGAGIGTKSAVISNGFVKKETLVVNKQSGVNTPLIVDNQNQGKEDSWITINKVEDIYKYLTDEVLAQEFKAFLHCKAQEEKVDYPVFTTTEKDGGYTAVVTYNGKQYNSLGVMLTKKQAEQSAAEVCLRKLGDFPSVQEDQYSIQIYKGGQIFAQTRKKEGGGNKQWSSLLQIVIGNLGIQFPSYRFKEVKEGTNTMYKAVCWFEGKVFESATSAETMVKAKQLAAIEALKFLGFEELQEAQDLRELIRIKKRRSYLPLGVLPSPLLYCPSRRTGWLFNRFEPLDEYTGKIFEEKAYEGVIDLIKRKGGPESFTELLSTVLSVQPSFGGQVLAARSDLSVAEVDSEHPNVVIIGNNEFAIRLYCQNGKIQCANRSCAVELLPGHNIRGLKCSYQITLPALQVYLKAESCDDLFYPNPPTPVVTTCGMVILLHDHEASAKDIHILLKRPSNNKTFVAKARSLATYLNKQISGSISRFNIAECTANISTWSQNEVKLLSQMTMDSMNELLSSYVRYDDRWNEIFAKEHPDGLRELKAACIGELKRRENEGIEIGDDDSEPWYLPNSRFRHRFLPTGILLEDNLMCTYRSVLESTGLKIKLSEMEASPTVDLPITDNLNAHRGDVCRYYVWKGCRKVSQGMEEPYYKGIDIVESLGDDWTIDEELEKIRAKKNKGKDKQRQKRKAQEETGKESNNGIKKEGGANDLEVTMDDDKKMDPVANIAPNMKDSTYVQEQEECRWFTLGEAKKVCPILNTISSTLQYQSQLKALQLEVTTLQKKGVLKG